MEWISIVIIISAALSNMIFPRPLYFALSAVSVIFTSVLHYRNTEEAPKPGSWFALALLSVVAGAMTFKTAIAPSLSVLTFYFFSRFIIALVQNNTADAPPAHAASVAVTNYIIEPDAGPIVMKESDKKNDTPIIDVGKIGSLVNEMVADFKTVLHSKLENVTVIQDERFEFGLAILEEAKKEIMDELVTLLGDELQSQTVGIDMVYSKLNALSIVFEDMESEIKRTAKAADIDLPALIKNGLEDLVKQDTAELLDHYVGEEAQNRFMDELIARLKKEQIDLTNTHHVRNEEIMEMFTRAIKTAQRELDIVSPWLSRWLLFGESARMLEDALKRGVTIKILYGYKDRPGDGSGRSGREDDTDFVVNELKVKFKKYIDKRLRFKKSNTHLKLLICDDVFYVIGSYNYLSFRGDYSYPDTRDEGADYSESKHRIKAARITYFDF